jgi:SAM-dependent methyltransferase
MTTEPDWLAANRASWDERVPIHVRSRFYGVDEFRAGGDPLRGRPFEPVEMGDVAGKSLVHLQCHFGLDTLAWARRGARVVGLDFSGPAVEAARALAAQAGLAAEFVQSDVYAAREALGGRTFDIVYTGRGALVWLPDIRRWAEVAASLVRPGGFLYLSEFHPFQEILGDDDLAVRYDYFHTEPKVWDEPGTYADPDARTQHNLTYEWTHGLGEVVTSIIEAGLRLDFLHEFDYTGYQRWPFLEKTAEEVYRLPAGMPSIPLAYTLKATKPA